MLEPELTVRSPADVALYAATASVTAEGVSIGIEGLSTVLRISDGELLFSVHVSGATDPDGKAIASEAGMSLTWSLLGLDLDIGFDMLDVDLTATLFGIAVDAKLIGEDGRFTADSSVSLNGGAFSNVVFRYVGGDGMYVLSGEAVSFRGLGFDVGFTRIDIRVSEEDVTFYGIGIPAVFKCGFDVLVGYGDYAFYSLINVDLDVGALKFTADLYADITGPGAATLAKLRIYDLALHPEEMVVR